jgi:hypothetical protein
MNRLLAKIPALLLTLIVGLIASSSAFATATIVIQIADDPGVGFNDTTAATPVGGNTGTTVGQQRLNAFQFAANIWGATLVSGPTIVISAKWSPFTNSCTATTGTLGSSGTTALEAGFQNSISGFWYSIAQANALVGSGDLNGPAAEISAQFNSNIGTTNCLTNSHWYYGLDNPPALPNGGIDLVTVLLHEFAHGLGFASFTDETDGSQAGNTPPGLPSIFDKFLLDNTTGKTWPQMTDAERVDSAKNDGNLVWNGPQVTIDAATTLTGGKDPQGHPQMFAPNPVKAGSSVSHWDRFPIVPDQLMEPFISNTLSYSVTTPQDLTFSVLRDIGWCAGCPQPPPPSPTPTPSPPPNDNFANGQLVIGCSGSVTGTNVGATRESGEPNNPVSPGSTRSVWYQWQAPSTGSATIDTIGSNFDTILGVYTGSSLATLSLVASNDDIASGNTDSTVTFNATQGTTYRIAVDGFNNSGSLGDAGNITLNWTESPCSQTAPTVLLEEGTTNRAAALDSVTFVRGPFPIIGTHNFSGDQHTRVIIFTSNLGLSQPSAALSVKASGTILTVENVGTVSGVAGLDASYIVVRLPDGLPTGDLSLTVTLNGAISNAALIGISP